MENPTAITVSATINAPVEKVWKCWNTPEHVIEWNHASPDWHTPSAANDLRIGGTFTYRMEARDGSMGFDFSGEYTEIIPHEHIAYQLADGRKVSVTFSGSGDATTVTETFDAENVNPEELQRAGWQAILDSFKNYTEAQA